MQPDAITFGRATREQLAGLSGLDALRAMIDGRLPAPTMARAMGFALAEVEPGRALFLATPSADVLNPLGGVHGGWALTLIDSAAGCAVHATLPAGVGYATLETKANFTHAITPDTGEVRCEGTVLSSGRRAAVAQARLTDGRGRLLAFGTSTLMIFAPEREGAR